MRLIAIPLARIRKEAFPVTTFLAQSTKAAAPPTSSQIPIANAANTGSTVSDEGKSLEGSSSVVGNVPKESSKKPPLTTRLLNKASDFWIGLGKEDQKSTFDWKRRTYNLGEAMMDRIEYEEWALKGVDPAFGPSLKLEEKIERKEAEQASKDVKEIIKLEDSPVAALNVPLLFPSSILTSSGILASLKRMSAARLPHHRQRLIWCVVGMPFTIPFALIPVLPNLPFFYLVWRAYSHWRAFNSSKYLSELIRQGRLVPTPSKELDQILANNQGDPTPNIQENIIEGQRKVETQEKQIDYESFLLMKPHTIKALEKTFNLDHQMSIDLIRARQQTIKAIQQGQMSKLEDAAAEAPSVSEKV